MEADLERSGAGGVSTWPCHAQSVDLPQTDASRRSGRENLEIRGAAEYITPVKRRSRQRRGLSR